MWKMEGNKKIIPCKFCGKDVEGVEIAGIVVMFCNCVRPMINQDVYHISHDAALVTINGKPIKVDAQYDAIIDENGKIALT